jgi:AcrR family transcriptional regulator
MARPLSATDDQILDAARGLAARRGPDGFTISEVARDIGLSRTAITLRFSCTEDLKLTLMKRVVGAFEARVQALEIEQGAAGLLAIADMIGEMAGDQVRFSGFMLRYAASVQDPVLLEIEERRARVLRSALMSAMPETAIDKSAAVDAFMANVTGSLLNWQTSDEADARAFLRKRTLNWLRLAGIPCDDERK